MENRPYSFALIQTWRARTRDQRLGDSLPEALEVLALVMQAGLDFQVALRYYLESGPQGPLREDLSAALVEIKTGVSRVDAMRHLAQRTTSRDLRETVTAVVQGFELGTSLCPLFKRQAKALRKRRAVEAEKKAALAPVKLMFPLFVFIFPTIFIVLFGPVVLSMMQNSQ